MTTGRYYTQDVEHALSRGGLGAYPTGNFYKFGLLRLVVILSENDSISLRICDIPLFPHSLYIYTGS